MQLYKDNITLVEMKILQLLATGGMVSKEGQDCLQNTLVQFSHPLMD